MDKSFTVVLVFWFSIGQFKEEILIQVIKIQRFKVIKIQPLFEEKVIYTKICFTELLMNDIIWQW